MPHKKENALLIIITVVVHVACNIKFPMNPELEDWHSKSDATVRKP